MASIAIEVTETSSKAPQRRVCKLPVSIGRGSNADVQLSADNRAISRVHLEILEERGKTVVYNRASNVEATLFQGRYLAPNERVEVVPGDVISIFGTEIRILEPARLGVLISHRADLKPIGNYRLLPGAALMLIDGDEGLQVEEIAVLADAEARADADRLVVLFYFDDNEPTCAVISNPMNEQLLLDRGVVNQQAIYLHSEDTIEISRYRFEVMTVGEASIVCENVNCQVLNASASGETCRVCGTRLFGTTRILRVRNI